MRREPWMRGTVAGSGCPCSTPTPRSQSASSAATGSPSLSSSVWHCRCSTRSTRCQGHREVTAASGPPGDTPRRPVVRAASEETGRAAVFRRRRRERADQLGSKADGARDEQDSEGHELVLGDEGAGPADDEVLLTVEEAVLADPEGGLAGPEPVLAGPELAGPWDAEEE